MVFHSPYLSLTCKFLRSFFHFETPCKWDLRNSLKLIFDFRRTSNIKYCDKNCQFIAIFDIRRSWSPINSNLRRPFDKNCHDLLIYCYIRYPTVLKPRKFKLTATRITHKIKYSDKKSLYSIFDLPSIFEVTKLRGPRKIECTGKLRKTAYLIFNHKMTMYIRILSPYSITGS